MANSVFRILARRLMHGMLRMLWGRMRKPVRIMHFVGLRRSGNHACINWLANSIYGRPVEYRQLGHYLFRAFPGSRVLLINSYAQEPALSIFRHIWRHRREIARCDTLFLSLEDEPPDFAHFLRPRKGTPPVTDVHIDRSVFNLLASRSKKISVESAKQNGGISGNFQVDLRLLRGFFAYRRIGTVHWDYDQWLIDPVWRRNFLDHVGLDRDIMPAMSKEAGGSSFGDTNTLHMRDAGKARYRTQSIPETWRQLIEHHFLQDLTPMEKAQLEELRAAAERRARPEKGATAAL